MCFRYHIINWPFVHGFSGYFLWSAESKGWRLCGRWTRSDADWNRSCRWLGQNWRDHTTHKSGSVPTRMFPLFLGYYFSCFTTFINIIYYIYTIFCIFSFTNKKEAPAASWKKGWLLINMIFRNHCFDVVIRQREDMFSSPTQVPRRQVMRMTTVWTFSLPTAWTAWIRWRCLGTVKQDWTGVADALASLLPTLISMSFAV